MSEFYARITGNDWETESTRCGHKTLGAEAEVKDWETAIRVRVFHEDDADVNWVYLTVRPLDGGRSSILYQGPLCEIVDYAKGLSETEKPPTFPEALDEVLMEEFGELGLNLAQSIKERCGANKTA